MAGQGGGCKSPLSPPPDAHATDFWTNIRIGFRRNVVEIRTYFRALCFCFVMVVVHVLFGACIGRCNSFLKRLFLQEPFCHPSTAVIPKVCSADHWWSAIPHKNQYFELRGALKYIKWSAFQKSLGTTVAQCCPTLSPFATCGDKKFECGDRQLLKNGFLMINKLHISQIVTKMATEKPLSPQLWQIKRQSEFGWTPLL